MRILCRLCKQEVKTNKFKPIVNNRQFPLCSQECFNKYLECWKDEKNFPENLKNVSIQSQRNKSMSPTLFTNSSDNYNKKYTKEEIESFPDY